MISQLLQKPTRGYQQKNLPDAENRGYGIVTSKKMLTEGLHGNYVMFSGEALHLKSSSIDSYIVLPDNIYWQGTVIALRVPCQ